MPEMLRLTFLVLLMKSLALRVASLAAASFSCRQGQGRSAGQGSPPPSARRV
jgi:hypothetical protein